MGFIRYLFSCLFYELLLELGISPQLTPQEKKLARKLARKGIELPRRDQHPLVYYGRQVLGAGGYDDEDDDEDE